MPSFAENMLESFRTVFTTKIPLIGKVNPKKSDQRGVLNKVFGDYMPHPESYSPEAQQSLYSEYQPSIGLPKESKFSSEAFAAYTNARPQDFLALKEATTPAGDLISNKLSKRGQTPEDQEAIKAVQNDLNEVLKLSKKYTKAQIDYEERIGTFKELLAEVPNKRSVASLIDTMRFVVDDGKKAIQEQQSKEIQRLNQKFTDENFKNNLTKSLDVTDSQLEKIKESLLKDLQDKHKKAMEDFDKPTQESLKQLHSATQSELTTFLFVASLHQDNAIMRQMIDKLAMENRNRFPTDNTVVELDSEKASITSVKPEQLEYIRTLGGEKIEQQFQDEEKTRPFNPPKYKLDMGSRIGNPRYYFRDKDEDDLLTLAQAVRASGTDGIVFELKFDNEKIAQKRARQAFEAAIKSGFPPEKIRINVNGKMLLAYKAIEKDEHDGMKYDAIQEKLYRGKESEFQKVIANGEKIRKQLEEVKPLKQAGSQEDLAAMKNKMEELRQQAKAGVKSTPDAGPTPISISPSA
jgi:hypothetical protein